MKYYGLVGHNPGTKQTASLLNVGIIIGISSATAAAVSTDAKIKCSSVELY